jgi:HK97 family phage major capsid protein
MNRWISRAVPLVAVCLLLALGAWFSPEGAALAPVGLGLIATAGLPKKELIDKQAELLTQARALVDLADSETRDLSAEEDAQFAAMCADADECKRAADAMHAAEQHAGERRTRLEAAEAALLVARNHGLDPARNPGSAAGRLPTGAATAEDLNLAIQGWFLENSDAGFSAEQRHMDAAQRSGINLRARHLRLGLDNDFRRVRANFRAAQSVGVGGEGGFTTFETFTSNLERAMLWYGPMLQLADVIRTADANPLHWPTANDTSNKGRQIGEAAAVAASEIAFQRRSWGAFKFTSDEILVSFELLRDSAINLAQLVSDMLGERLGRILNERFTIGTGAGTARGVVVAAPTGKTTASATAITADELLDLQYSVDRAYRDNPASAYMFHDNVLLAIRKLKDGEGNYHWSPGLQAGEPGSLFNRPVHVNNDMASSIATGAFTGLFGDFSKYKARMVAQVRIYRLLERHRENDQDAFLAFVEADGDLLDAGGNPVKRLEQA